MYRLTFLLLFALNLPAFGQDTVAVDRTVEGVHKKSMCDVDTLIIVHYDKNFVIKDSTDLSYEFTSGSKTYVEIRLRSTACSCKDCSFADHLLIDVSGVKAGEKITLTNSNTTWIHWNSLMMVNSENNITGTIVYTGTEDFLVEIFKYLPAQPPVKYDGIRVVKS